MATAVSFGQITLTDLTDIGNLSVYPTANQPLSVIYNPDQSSYTPNWSSTNLVCTPVIYYGGTQLTASTSGLSITWTRQEGTAAATALTTGETKQTDGSLKVTANKFTTSSTMISYIVIVNYTEPESGTVLTAEGKITFSMVKQASSAKTCSITGDTVFKYNTSQSIVGATSITLTATVNNVSISAWQYQKSDGTWATYPSSNTGQTLTVKATDSTFVNDKCLVKLVTNDSSVYDLHTITKLRDGVAGTSTIAAVLTNEDQMIPCNSSGTPTSFDGAETEIMIYRGSTIETSSWTISLAATSGLTYQVSTDGTNWSSSGTTGNWTHVKITGMTVNTGNVTFTCTKSGETTLVKTFSLVKITAGADGTNATIYTLEASALAVNKDISGAFTPSSVTVYGYSKTGSSNRAAYSGRFKVYAGSTSGTVIYTSTSNQSSYTITSSNITSAASAGYLTVVLYAAGGTSTVLDTQTIVITSDGATGSQGPQGNAGADAINVVLGNYADVIACTSANKPSAAMTIEIPFTGYKGTTQVACTVATPANLCGVAPSVTQATATAAGKISYALTTSTSISAASGTISLTFTCEGKTIPMIYRWTRSTAATNGANAIVLTLLTPNGTVFSNGTGSLTLTGALYNGASEQTSSVTWAWAKYNGSTYANVATTKSITVNGSDVDGFASYRCQATYSSKTYTAYVSVIDKTDPLQCEVFSSIGDQIINGVGAGAFYVIVTQSGVEVDPIKSTRFLTAAPSNPATGDFYYHVDASAKTVTLKKYSGSAWANAGSADLPTGTYEWTHMDTDGNTITHDKLATTGKVIYMDGTLFDKKIVSNVKVTI